MPTILIQNLCLNYPEQSCLWPLGRIIRLDRVLQRLDRCDDGVAVSEPIHRFQAAWGFPSVADDGFE
jgi:hypothetical protein